MDLEDALENDGIFFKYCILKYVSHSRKVHGPARCFSASEPDDSVPILGTHVVEEEYLASYSLTSL